MDTKKITDVIRDMAQILRAYADEIEYDAEYIEKSGDIYVVGDVAGKICVMMSRLRLDLLVKRPIRELNREIEKGKIDGQ